MSKVKELEAFKGAIKENKKKKRHCWYFAVEKIMEENKETVVNANSKKNLQGSRQLRLSYNSSLSTGLLSCPCSYAAEL